MHGVTTGERCLACSRELNERRSVDTNYLHPGLLDDAYACGGCLSVFAVEWRAVAGLGNDGWAMFVVPPMLLAGGSVAQVIARLEVQVAAGEGRRGLDDLYRARGAELLVRVPEVVAAAWPGFGGRALAAVHLGFPVSSTSVTTSAFGGQKTVWRIDGPTPRLRAPTPQTLERLLAQPDKRGFRTPSGLMGVAPRDTALLTAGMKLAVVGAEGPFVKVRPSPPLWEGAGELEHFFVTLDQLALAAP